MKVRNLILILAAAAGLAAQTGDADVMLQRAIRKESVEGDLKGAIDLYKKVIAGAAKNRAAAAKALLRLGECYEKQGDAEARRAYERLVNEYSDQKEQARDAQARLTTMGQTASDGKSMVAQLIAKARDLGLGGRVTLDGKLCPFIDPETGDVAVRDLGTNGVKRLTNEGAWARSGYASGWYPMPSRDGKQIAYLWYPDREKTELRVINIDGSGMRTVPVKLGMYSEIFDWSADGKRVLVEWYVHQPSWWGFAAIDVESGEVHRLGRLIRDPMDVAGFSPDERWIVYSRQIPWRPDWEILAIDTQTGREIVIVPGEGANRKPMWVPDSDKIVFRSDRNGKSGIWMVRILNGQAAGAPVLIKPDAGDYNPKGISRDGSLFYGLRQESADVYQATVDPQTLRVQGAPARVVQTYLGRNSKPSWSPSGDSFAYFSDRDGKLSQLMVHHSNGKETVTDGRIWFPGERLPDWCGSGERLVFSELPLAGQTWLFDAHTGAEIRDGLFQFNRSGVSFYNVGFSPDCKSVYVVSHAPNTSQRRIYRSDISGTETDLLKDTDGWAGGRGGWKAGPRVSPDGQWLALDGELSGGKQSGLLLLSTAGGSLRMLDPEGLPGHNWTPDSKRLMYRRKAKLPNGQGYENELYWVSVEGGARQSMGIRMPGATAPSINADGKRILFSATEGSNELWVLRNLPLK